MKKKPNRKKKNKGTKREHHTILESYTGKQNIKLSVNKDEKKEDKKEEQIHISKYSDNSKKKEEKEKPKEIKIIKPEVDYIPYSCIPELEEIDKTYHIEDIQQQIKANERKIPLHKRAQNLDDDENRLMYEYDIFNQIEDSKFYQDIFEYGFEELDRYSDIKPYKYNKIVINTKNKYINASPINIQGKKNLFISTQGPKPETIEDFWTMVEDYDSNVIVMLCKLMEGGRIKCENYWEAKIKKYEIKIMKIDKGNMYEIRELKLKNNSTKKEKIVYQIHFLGWPDHGIPDTSKGTVFEVFNSMIKKVDELNKGEKPIIVHCSAGVGRTGTFVSMYLLEKDIMKQINDKKKEIRINVFNLVRKIKEMRIYMVQTPIQYKFVYLYVRYLLEKNNI